jgi:IS30 family transposase
MIKDRDSIHDRPKKIEGRADIGHWEGDLIICKRTRPVLVLHERKSRVTPAARLAGKTAAETISVILAVFGRINPALRKSVTFDNDTTFAQHALLRTGDPQRAWQRRANPLRLTPLRFTPESTESTKRSSDGTQHDPIPEKSRIGHTHTGFWLMSSLCDNAS